MLHNYAIMNIKKTLQTFYGRISIQILKFGNLNFVYISSSKKTKEEIK